MIIVKDKSEKTRIYIDKNLSYYSDNLTLVLHSRSTNQKYYFDCSDEIEYTYMYVLDVDFSNVKSGEYEYELKSEDVKLATGMLRIQDKQVEGITYHEEIKYTMYEPR